MDKVLGIIGGMGPAATVDLMDKIIAVVLPQPQQEVFHQSIFDFKVSGDKEAFGRVVRQSMDKLIELGAGAIILGCTEIPIVASGEYQGVALVDPNQIIAERVVAYAKAV